MFHSKHATAIALAAIWALSGAAAAQEYDFDEGALEFYVGTSIGYGNFDYKGDVSGSHSSSGAAASIFGGARLPLNPEATNGFFIGGELEISTENGWNANVPLGIIQDGANSLQVEFHLGYRTPKVAYFGYAGVASKGIDQLPDFQESAYTFVGIGADIGLSERLALRIEAELGDMTIHTLDTYELRKTELNIGLVYNF